MYESTSAVVHVNTSFLNFFLNTSIRKTPNSQLRWKAAHLPKKIIVTFFIHYSVFSTYPSFKKKILSYFESSDTTIIFTPSFHRPQCRYFLQIICLEKRHEFLSLSSAMMMMIVFLHTTKTLWDKLYLLLYPSSLYFFTFLQAEDKKRCYLVFAHVW